MNLAAEIRHIRRVFPNLNSKEIGKVVGCMHEYVRAVLRRERIGRLGDHKAATMASRKAYKKALEMGTPYRKAQSIAGHARERALAKTAPPVRRGVAC